MSNATAIKDLAGNGEPITEYFERTSFRRALTGVYIVWYRDIIRFTRDRIRMFGALMQPMLYLFLLGYGMQSTMKMFARGSEINYVAFMFPGILGMTVLFTSVFSAISILWDREFGFLKEVLVSPVPRTSVAFGKILGGATQAMLQALILCVLMFLPFMFGASWITLWNAIRLVPVTALLAVAMTGIGVAIAANMTSMEGFPMVMNLFLMPSLFTSGAMFQLQGLPGWLDFISRINPLTYGVDMLKQVALSGTETGFASGRYEIWVDLLVMTGVAIVAVSLAVWQFNRKS